MTCMPIDDVMKPSAHSVTPSRVPYLDLSVNFCQLLNKIKLRAMSSSSPLMNAVILIVVSPEWQTGGLFWECRIS